MKKKTSQYQYALPDINVGLTAEDVAMRVKAKHTNKTKKVVGKSYLQIFVSNIFTFFNLLGFIIFILMALCGSWSNMMFVVVILANTVVGIFQEIRSKIAVEKLSIVSEPTVDAIRDGKQQQIKTQQIVLDDILLYTAGKQVCTDAIIEVGEVEVNESMLTGESEPVKKKRGDILYSGSFVVSGNCTVRVTAVGKDNYIEQLSAKVKTAKMPNSRIIKGIMSIIKVIAIIIFPLGIATFFTSAEIASLVGVDNVVGQYFQGVAEIKQTVNDAIVSAAGSMIGMVPSGMVLLTSMTLAVAALKLAHKKVLVRELPCIEMLARVDTLCLDKTGTITDGSMTVEQIIPVDGDETTLKQLLATLVAGTQDNNATAVAVSNYLKDVAPLPTTAVLPFSSVRKFSAVTTKSGTIAMGAAEFMFKRENNKSFFKQIDKYLAQGLRVLAVGKSNHAIKKDGVDGLVPCGIILLQDTIRADAPEIIKWFVQNDVQIKVISGDNPLSVSVIAQKVGVAGAEKYISLEGMTEEEVWAVANDYTVFGRVTPEQKAILVKAMKAQDHTVAMTGDGVNDILAMRESDCAISVGCGTDAAKTAANLVLMDNKFGCLPNVVAEGRQVVNNIQNSSTLFLMKTCMTVFTTILLLFLPYSYPFAPQNLYAVEFFVNGIPAFLLALKPNRNRIKGDFVKNILKRVIPNGIAMFGSVALTYIFAKTIGLTVEPNGLVNADQITTVAMLAMTSVSVLGLWVIMFPFDMLNIGIGLVSTLGVPAFLTLAPLVYNAIFKDAIALDPSKAMQLTVAIPTNAIWFIVINVLLMTAIMVVGRIVITHLERKNPQLMQ
ncbi:MAG: HAD-IC family P-type ATPase [Clostridia bacterium]|nr:HAD-IC family P-type ATPase [Clostridia bacterium]